MDIERLFNEEIRDKKRVGRNIFSRVSTRKGGGNQALRTPSYFMKGNNKYKKLSGEVETYNLNNILSHQEFQEKNKAQQRMFMEAWREKYKAKEIQDNMGISKNIYYKIIEELGLSTNSLGQGKRGDVKERTILSDEELQKYMGNFIDFSIFKTLIRHQQITLLENYLRDFPVQSELAKVWGADLKYVYYISGYAKKQRAKEEAGKQKENKDEILDDIEDIDTILPYEEFKKLSDESQRELLIHWRSKYMATEIKNGMGISDGTLHGIISRLDVPRILGKRKGVPSTPVQNDELESSAEVFNGNSESDTPIAEVDDEVIDNKDIEKPQDDVLETVNENIEADIENSIKAGVEDNAENSVEETQQNNRNANSLTVEIKGNYSTNAIMKSIQSILLTLEGEEEVINIDLKVRKG